MPTHQKCRMRLPEVYDPNMGTVTPAEERLRLAVEKGLIANAYLLVGPEGTGRSALARKFAKWRLCLKRGCGECLDCRRIDQGQHPNVFWVRPEEGKAQITISQVRELQRLLRLRPDLPSPRIPVITPAEAMNEEAMNALLKLLEEPPEGVTVLLISVSASSLLRTILSRCQILRFFPLPDGEIRTHLERREGLRPEIRELILTLAGGSLAEADRLAEEAESLAAMREDVRRAQEQGEWSRLVDSYLKGKDALETRRRARLLLDVAIAEARSRLASSPDLFRTAEQIDLLLEHRLALDGNANAALCVTAGLLSGR